MLHLALLMPVQSVSTRSNQLELLPQTRRINNLHNPICSCSEGWVENHLSRRRARCNNHPNMGITAHTSRHCLMKGSGSVSVCWTHTQSEIAVLRLNKGAWERSSTQAYFPTSLHLLKIVAKIAKFDIQEVFEEGASEVLPQFTCQYQLKAFLSL